MNNEHLSYQQTLPRELVHKHAIDEVFLTSYSRQGPAEMLLGAVLPRAHGFYCEFPLQDQPPDFALVVEVCRQACFVVAHTLFDVPVKGNKYQFMLQRLSASVISPEAIGEARPVTLALECHVPEKRHRGNVPSALVWDFAIRSGAAKFAAARFAMTWIERPQWRKMRDSMRCGRGLPATLVMPVLPRSQVAPADVGRVNPENIVLERIVRDGDSYCAPILANIRHPVLFDHPIDHIFGMVQLEACRQLALFAVSDRYGCPPTSLAMSGCDAEFRSVAEFDLATVLRARLSPEAGDGLQPAETDVTIELMQGTRKVSDFTISIAAAGPG